MGRGVVVHSLSCVWRQAVIQTLRDHSGFWGRGTRIEARRQIRRLLWHSWWMMMVAWLKTLPGTKISCRPIQTHSRYQCVVTNIIVHWTQVNVSLTVRQSVKLLLWIERAPIETASAKVSFQETMLNRLTVKKMASK